MSDVPGSRLRRYELVGHEGGIPPIVLAFRHPWGLYVCFGFGNRSKRMRVRVTLGPMFGGGLRVRRVKASRPRAL